MATINFFYCFIILQGRCARFHLQLFIRQSWLLKARGELYSVQLLPAILWLSRCNWVCQHTHHGALSWNRRGSCWSQLPTWPLSQWWWQLGGLTGLWIKSRTAAVYRLLQQNDINLSFISRHMYQYPEGATYAVPSLLEKMSNSSHHLQFNALRKKK